MNEYSFIILWTRQQDRCILATVNHAYVNRHGDLSDQFKPSFKGRIRASRHRQ